MVFRKRGYLLTGALSCGLTVVQSTDADGDSPVWLQVLWHHLGHSNTDLAEQAAAALQAHLLDF